MKVMFRFVLIESFQIKIYKSFCIRAIIVHDQYGGSFIKKIQTFITYFWIEDTFTFQTFIDKIQPNQGIS